MKALFVSNLFPDRSQPYRGLDNATVLHHLARDFEIRAIALRPSLPFMGRLSVAREADTEFEPVFARVPYLPKVGSLVNHRLAAGALRRPLHELRRRFPFEVVLGSWIYPDCCALAILAKEEGFPFVAIAQGSDVHQYLRNPVRRRVIQQWLPLASGVITRSAELARLLAEGGILRERLHPVYNGIDFETFRTGSRSEARQALGLPKDAPIILFVGNLLPIKNPLLLVEAHASLCRDEKRFQSAHLVMVGGGPLDRTIRQNADALGFGTQVQLAGRCRAEEVARFMQAADVLCLPSQNEGVPNVILEAFACGLRVVASRVGGIPEVHPGDGFGKLTPAGDAAVLRAALSEVLAGSFDREAIHFHARQFSWERAASAYREILSRTVTEKNQPLVA